MTLYLLRLKTVDILMRSLDEAESQVRKNESRLSEEDIVPADTAAIQNLSDQLGVRKHFYISPQLKKGVVKVFDSIIFSASFGFRFILFRSGRLSSPSMSTSSSLCSQK